MKAVEWVAPALILALALRWGSLGFPLSCWPTYVAGFFSGTLALGFLAWICQWLGNRQP